MWSHAVGNFSKYYNREGVYIQSMRILMRSGGHNPWFRLPEPETKSAEYPLEEVSICTELCDEGSRMREKKRAPPPPQPNILQARGGSGILMPIKPEIHRPLTTRDVAAAANVNQSTVSRALRNDPKIRAEVRKKILKCAEDLGYRPNPYVSAFTASVRSYRRSPNGAVLGLLDCYPKESPYYHDRTYRAGAEQRARELGFLPEVFCLEDLNYSLKRLNKVLWTRSIQGLLVLPVPIGFDLTEVEFDRVASSTVDTSLHLPVLHRAEPDYFQGMQLALKMLEARGYQRITFCTTRKEVELLDEEWLGSFMGWQAMKTNPLRMEPYIGEDYERGPFKAWLKKHRPDAIITNVDHYFGWCLEFGFETSRIAHVALSADPTKPQLAGVSQNQHAVGVAAVDIILEQIHRNDFGLPAKPKKVLIQGSWVEGASVRGEAPAKTDFRQPRARRGTA